MDIKVKPPLHLVKNSSRVRQLDIKKASELKDRPQTWLWEDFIPYETCTLIAGMPGIGKSQFLMWFSAMVSMGGTFKLNSREHTIEQGSTFILSCEDSEETGILPRLKVLGANLEKIYLFRCSFDKDDPDNRKLIAIEADINLIEEEIKKVGDVKLIIIDPIAGFSGKANSNAEEDVRNLVNKLNELAEKYKCAVILNKHLRKPKGDANGIGAAINEVAGSIAWVAVVRQAFIIARHHEDDSLVLFSNLKANLCAKNIEAYGYRISSKQYENIEGQLIKTSNLEWTSEIFKISADEMLNKKLFDEKSKTQQVTEYIFDRLMKSGGSVSSTEIINECMENFGVKETVIYDIKKKLKIFSSGKGKGSRWSLSNESPVKI